MKMPRLVLDSAAVDLATREETLALVANTLGDPEQPALALASANLDHFHHFGADGPSNGRALLDTSELRWKILLDGAPVAAVVRWRTGESWPLLTGSDLLPEILAVAAAGGHTVGFLGGTAAMHDRLRAVLAEDFPGLDVAGTWAPSRAELNDAARAEEITDEIRGAAPEILVVGLGKPRQEEWIQLHAAQSGARVLLAFGAATDFLAGLSTRAPRWVRRLRIEWLYRLVREPRRLYRRYLIEGPRAALGLIRSNPQSSTRASHDTRRERPTDSNPVDG
jgi:N-acetylglucosaminyldiphosphoundecaprenol N-acetyl-beta-D-mannosaminyltransferase